MVDQYVYNLTCPTIIWLLVPRFVASAIRSETTTKINNYFYGIHRESIVPFLREAIDAITLSQKTISSILFIKLSAKLKVVQVQYISNISYVIKHD